MQPTPVSDFFKYLLGFMTFLTVSFGVTFTVNELAKAKDLSQAAAAARAATLNLK